MIYRFWCETRMCFRLLLSELIFVKQSCCLLVVVYPNHTSAAAVATVTATLFFLPHTWLPLLLLSVLPSHYKKQYW